MRKAILAALCCSALGAYAAAPARFVSRHVLPSGDTVVVAAGDFEPPEAGSYSVRLYQPARARGGAPVFASGLVLPRHGSVEKVMLDDVNADGTVEVVVVFRGEDGSERFSAQVFDVVDAQVTPVFDLSDPVSEADLMTRLHERAERHEELTRRQAARLKK
ncbi:hypothetical protein G3580_07925 [Nitrogeniibacter mangrovi]|uniref:PliI/PliC-like inhibitor of I-type lysozyme n=1 Tax=Nitrogeniibacter mangrovi TaxID=2016596 RepID=A0A6C1B3L4_9RHOO|nr:PliI family lysozyme inhibitor of I-type lysozyme [Nitrogeniibacter mangrovi]QID17579.1 hypothetical protein G3580_07925 [Nitrogeniibacter mangrovi]